MPRLTRWLFAALLVACLPADSRAAKIEWSYSTFAFPNSLPADVPGSGGFYIPPPFPPGYSSGVGLNFTPAGGQMAGNSYATLATLYGSSGALADTPDVYKNATYFLTVGLRDKASGKSGLLTFTGFINGTYSSQHSALRFSFDRTKATLHLGLNYYDVTLRPVLPPGSGPSAFGIIGADVVIRPNPEPGTLALLALGGAGGVVMWRRGRKRPEA